MEKINIAVQRAVAETLENLAFMEAFPVSESPLSCPGEMTAALHFHEPTQGEIRISIPPTLLENISQNVFGLPSEDVSVPESKDLLAELLNTIAGRFFIELLPKEQPFRIGLPELDPSTLLEPDSHTNWYFRTGEHHFTISLSKLITPIHLGPELDCTVR